MTDSERPSRLRGMRRAAALTMVVVTAFLLAAAAIAWYADDTLVDDREFATRLTSSLDHGDVRGVDADQIVTHVVPELRPGDVVAIMSNGGFGGIHDKILSALENVS